MNDVDTTRVLTFQEYAEWILRLSRGEPACGGSEERRGSERGGRDRTTGAGRGSREEQREIERERERE